MIRATQGPDLRHRRRPARRRPDASRCCARATRSACSSSRAGPMRALMRSLAPDQLRRRRRPRRPLPAGADGGQHAQRLRRPQERPQAGRVPPPRPRGAPRPTPTGLMIYQESVMRVAQKFAGYSLAEADNLRKACGKKIRELIAAEREKFVDGCERTGYGARARHAAVRHHRALRRLRLQQEPLLRLRPRRLPDRLPQGPLPGRVPRLPAHQRQGQPGEGGGLPGRVPGHGHPGARPRRQPLAVGLRRPRPDAVPPACSCPTAARASSRSGCRRCATWARAWSS